MRSDTELSKFLRIFLPTLIIIDKLLFVIIDPPLQ